MHGVNLDQLGRRDPPHYGSLTLTALEHRIAEGAESSGSSPGSSRPTTRASSSSICTASRGWPTGLILNPGSWTHYSCAIRDALELAGLPAVEVHLSDVDAREEWRRHSVIDELCVGRVAGRGPEGYRDALRASCARELTRMSAARADKLAARLPEAGIDVAARHQI